MCDKEQLTIQKIKEDHKDTLNALIKVWNGHTVTHTHRFTNMLHQIQKPVHGLSEEEQIDKAAKVTVINVLISDIITVYTYDVKIYITIVHI